VLWRFLDAGLQERVDSVVIPASQKPAQERSFCRSFDHLVGERQQGGGHGYAEFFSGLQIDHQSKLARLLNRKIAERVRGGISRQATGAKRGSPSLALDAALVHTS
jgi:hypothetical protein